MTGARVSGKCLVWHLKPDHAPPWDIDWRVRSPRPYLVPAISRATPTVVGIVCMRCAVGTTNTPLATWPQGSVALRVQRKNAPTIGSAKTLRAVWPSYYPLGSAMPRFMRRRRCWMKVGNGSDLVSRSLEFSFVSMCSTRSCPSKHSSRTLK